MGKKILGLDLGENSIGWALVEHNADELNNNPQGRILGTGTIIPKAGGKENDNPGIIRRQKRQLRRQVFRTRLRKLLLIKLLMEHKMFPPVPHEDLVARLQALQLDDDLRGFFRIDPYEKRKEAVEGKKLSLYELGRVFYHMAQRRGYKENRLAESDADESGAIYTGNPKDDKKGIDETRQAMGQQTLGQYLAGLNPHKERRRNRYTLRSMYLKEFDSIWKKQKAYYPDLLTDELKHRIGDEKEGVLFFQRKLKSQKSLVRKCTFEFDYVKDKNKKESKRYLTVCPKSSPIFEQFRMYQFINSIEMNGIKLIDCPGGELYRQKLVALFNQKEELTFKDIKKLIKSPDAAFNYPDDKIIPGNKTIARLRKLFNYSEKEYVEKLSEAEKAQWKKLPQPEIDRRLNIWEHLSPEEQMKRWHVFYSFDNTDKIIEHAQKHGWNLPDERLALIKKVRLEQGYANLSHRAIGFIMPYLQKGYIYSEAVLLGSIQRVFKKDWQEFAPEEKSKIEQQTVAIIRQNSSEGKSIDRIKTWLKTTYSRTDRDLERLYHHSDLENPPGDASELGFPPAVRNPTVQKVLGALRKLVNSIMATYGRPDRIVIELAREMNLSEREKQEMERTINRNERINNEAKRLLAEKGLPPTIDNIQKWILWEECRKVCPYTGKKISFEDLFVNARFQVEHIVPRSISLDNSMANKTLCEASENLKKGQQTPYQFYGSNPQKWEEIKTRLWQMVKRSGTEEPQQNKSVIPDSFPYSKLKRFLSEQAPAPEGFISRQLNDTRYIAKEAKNYLAQICKAENIIVAQGGATALLKHYWGLENIEGVMQTVIPLYHEDISKFNLKNEQEYLAALDAKDRPVQMYEWSTNAEINKSNREALKKQGRVVQGLVQLHPAGRQGQLLAGKNRADHRHHALDAITLACMQKSHLQKIATLIGEGRKFKEIKEKNLFPLPWRTFRADVRAALCELLTVHPQPQQKVVADNKKHIEKNGKKYLAQGMTAKGALHEESYYGFHKNKKTGEGEYRKRKPLESITTMKQVHKIVDEGVRQQVIRRLQEIGIDTNNPKTDFSKAKNVFFESDAEGRKIPKVFMPNKNGEPVPVKKVRVAENLGTAVPLPGKVNRWVKPGGNYGVAIYRDAQGKYHERVVTFWEAVERQKQQIDVFPTVNSQGHHLILTLQKNELFLLGLHPDEIEWNNPSLLSAHLYRVQKLTAGDYYFRLHKAATVDIVHEGKYIKSLNSFFTEQHPIKVRLDALGNIVRV
ncbi:type II CRISPR RNA-guided endonuclease Cas9 [Rhodoflexus caldus]|uniref:type II CRISPR RNA-guided endonuclease Cas9 n=1 Tax=Rhodoflexus caldus TaxID=2891236 RepID=UPI00202A0D03|nr:type II CRISPR RNA-guided endonuclease Cas9 [Rhodoflexus caldus]